MISVSFQAVSNLPVASGFINCFQGVKYCWFVVAHSSHHAENPSFDLVTFTLIFSKSTYTCPVKRNIPGESFRSRFYWFSVICQLSWHSVTRSGANHFYGCLPYHMQGSPEAPASTSLPPVLGGWRGGGGGVNCMKFKDYFM